MVYLIEVVAPNCTCISAHIWSRCDLNPLGTTRDLGVIPHGMHLESSYGQKCLPVDGLHLSMLTSEILIEMHSIDNIST